MASVRKRPVISMLAILSVLLVAGARTLHSETTSAEHGVTRATTANTGPCYLCDTPDCAAVSAVVVVTPPQVTHGEVVLSPQAAHVWTEDMPLHVRPPPVI